MAKEGEAGAERICDAKPGRRPLKSRSTDGRNRAELMVGMVIMIGLTQLGEVRPVVMRCHALVIGLWTRLVCRVGVHRWTLEMKQEHGATRR
jgi:hypothetical protein